MRKSENPAIVVTMYTIDTKVRSEKHARGSADRRTVLHKELSHVQHRSAGVSERKRLQRGGLEEQADDQVLDLAGRGVVS